MNLDDPILQRFLIPEIIETCKSFFFFLKIVNFVENVIFWIFKRDNFLLKY